MVVSRPWILLFSSACFLKINPWSWSWVSRIQLVWSSEHVLLGLFLCRKMTPLCTWTLQRTKAEWWSPCSHPWSLAVTCHCLSSTGPQGTVPQLSRRLQTVSWFSNTGPSEGYWTFLNILRFVFGGPEDCQKVSVDSLYRPRGDGNRGGNHMGVMGMLWALGGLFSLKKYDCPQSLGQLMGQ